MKAFLFRCSVLLLSLTVVFGELLSATEIAISKHHENHLLMAEIETSRLRLKSVTNSPQDTSDLITLFSDPVVIEKYGDGTVKTKDWVISRIHTWIKRLQDGDPFVGYLVFLKENENSFDSFIGLVILGYAGQPGESEMAYLFKKEYWGKGYGTEACEAMVKDFAPFLVKHHFFLGHTPLKSVSAWARLDNVASIRILEKIGMLPSHVEKKWGHLRRRYWILITD